ncbi:hypothetical protein Ade02nite_03680 [Paractinoplanes deccanensis]|uniref:FMN-binding domain-containing protein n=1 Tax=Paractinoplanes deccanensis TaxID=113561 RepID=A0ABQ3XVF1_9ACTN|nr:FMN-binding protein [Actinoplanes deccanensis]GID71727.1 hypothetical protein Ade02nite_03680 [Actinoplanes deccanensis]
MRRSTAAAVGTLTGAALIVGVRLSVEPPAAPVAAPPAVDLAGGTPTPKPKPTGSAAGSSAGNKSGKATASKSAAPKSGLKDGVYKGDGARNPYGTVQVSIRIEGGEITAAEATYPTTADSGTINPPAIAALKQETLGAKSAKDLNAVSGATYTSKSYAESLQAALDAAKA